MKKHIMLLLLAPVILVACQPNITDKKLPEAVSKFDLVVENTSEGSNEILLENRTRGTVSNWNWGISSSTDQKLLVRMPYMGDISIDFYGISPGGFTKITRTVKITKIDKPAAEEWALFAGTDPAGKVWVWGEGDEVYGGGGFGYTDGPAWGFVPKSAMLAQKGEDPTNEMVFDLQGAANFTKRRAGGEVISKGTFRFDMNKKRGTWSIGELQITGSTVLIGITGSGAEIHTFDILKLTATEMVLGWASPGTPFPSWSGTFWVFAAK